MSYVPEDLSQVTIGLRFHEEDFHLMTNLEYELMVAQPILGSRRKFNPGPPVSEVTFFAILYAMGCRAVAPRLPRLGERVLTRCIEAAERDLPWGQSVCTPATVINVGSRGGEPIEAFLDNGESILRPMHNRTWIYEQGYGPKEVLS